MELLMCGPVQSVATDVHPPKPVVMVPGRTDYGIFATLPSPLARPFGLAVRSTADGRRITQLRPTSSLPNVGCSWGIRVPSGSRLLTELSDLVLGGAVSSTVRVFTFTLGFSHQPLYAFTDRGDCLVVRCLVARPWSFHHHHRHTTTGICAPSAT